MTKTIDSALNVVSGGRTRKNARCYEERSTMRLFEVSSDSTCDLYEDYRKQRDIYFAPLTFSMEKNGEIKEYLDNFSQYSQYVDF